MKNLKILTFLAFSFVLFSCKKDKEQSYPLVGEWELRESVDGQSGEKTNYPAGNGTIIKFTRTDYEILYMGETVKKGVYNVVKYVSYLTKKNENKIVYDGQTDTIQVYFTIDGNSLFMYVDANDGPSSGYTRIK